MIFFFLMIVLKVSFKFLHPHLPGGFLVPKRHGKVKPNLITRPHLAMSVCSESVSFLLCKTEFFSEETHRLSSLFCLIVPLFL